MDAWIRRGRTAFFFLLGLGVGYLAAVTLWFLAYVLPHGGMW
jgi:hypothetical protein